MLPAYNDPLGLTAAFNLNLLARINRELGGNFNLSNFEHEARYNEIEQRIEMHLRAKTEHTVNVTVHQVGFSFQKDETIWTESSYKFHPEQIRRLSSLARFNCEAQWIDAEWPFVQSLFRAV